MTTRRRLLTGAGVVALGYGAVLAYQKLTHDGRWVGIDIAFGGANGEWAASGASLPLYDSYDIGLGFFDIAIAARAHGLIVDLKPADHDLAWPGELVIYTLEKQIVVPISGTEEIIPIYDNAKPAAGSAEGPLFVGNLKLTASFRDRL